MNQSSINTYTDGSVRRDSNEGKKETNSNAAILPTPETPYIVISHEILLHNNHILEEGQTQ